jgi:hypothetical protein
MGKTLIIAQILININSIVRISFEPINLAFPVPFSIYWKKRFS